MSVHICATPMEVVYKRTDGVRWCFVCRKRVGFFYLVRDTIEQPSYYDPIPGIECQNGHDNGDLFPGRIRDWWGEFE